MTRPRRLTRLSWLLGVGILLGLFQGLFQACSDAAPVAQGVSRAPVLLTAEVDRAEARVGEEVIYKVTLDHDPQVPVTMPDVFSQIKGFNVSDIKDDGPRSRDGRTLHSRTFKLTAFDTGSYILPAVEVRWKDASGQERQAGTPQIFVEIKTVLTDPAASPAPGESPVPGATPAVTEDIADIKPVEAPPVDYRRLALLAGGGLAVVLLLAGGLYGWSHRRREEPPAPPPTPPWEVALAALQTLEGQDLVGKGEPRAYCFALSEIFRRYLEGRFRFPALEQSTEEILVALRRADVPVGRPHDLVRRVLTGADYVKFAKAVPLDEEARALLSACREFVQATTPVVVPETQEGGA